MKHKKFDIRILFRNQNRNSFDKSIKYLLILFLICISINKSISADSTSVDIKVIGTSCYNGIDGKILVEAKMIEKEPLVIELKDTSGKILKQEVMHQSSVLMLEGLQAGDYVLSVGKELKNIKISQPEELSGSLTILKIPDSNEECNGRIELKLKGGTPPYEYNWEGMNDEKESIIKNLCFGFYNCKYTDKNKCGPYSIGAALFKE